MSTNDWPDQLTAPDTMQVQTLLEIFWRQLRSLPELLARQEHLLADLHTAALRNVVIEMMLALNGIQWPKGTQHLNSYLGESQRKALEKTLATPLINDAAWIGRAVALVVIYQWYAPQLTEKYQLTYPQRLEEEVLALMHSNIPAWPAKITTEIGVP